MSLLWIGVIAASLGTFVLKWLGYQVPPDVLERPRIARITALLPIALLGALVATQGFTDGQAIVLDARVAGLAVAAVLLALRAPFLVVVIAAALAAAGLRMLGWGLTSRTPDVDLDRTWPQSASPRGRCSGTAGSPSWPSPSCGAGSSSAS